MPPPCSDQGYSDQSGASPFDHYLKALDEQHSRHHSHHTRHFIEEYRKDISKLLTSGNLSPSRSPRKSRHLSSFRSNNQSNKSSNFQNKQQGNDSSLAGYLMPICHKKRVDNCRTRKYSYIPSSSRGQFRTSTDLEVESPSTVSPNTSASSSPTKGVHQGGGGFPNSPSSPGLYSATYTFSSPARSDFSPGEVEYQGRSFVEAILSRRERKDDNGPEVVS